MLRLDELHAHREARFADDGANAVEPAFVVPGALAHLRGEFLDRSGQVERPGVDQRIEPFGMAAEPLGERSYGQDRWRQGNYGAGSWLGANHGEWRDFDGGRRYARSGGDDRGFFERAGEAIGRWFGDDDGYGRRRENYRGHGPAGYTRTDERIREDVSERLTEDWAVDARKIEVTVSGGEITLDGTVTSRDQKRRAEDIAENVSGVKHVQNNLRVDEGSTWDRNNSGEATVTTTR